MDLRHSSPRSMREVLGGYVHLARMIDKAKAVLAGTQGEYIYPCPMDQRLLRFAGLTPEAFLDAVQGRSDASIADWFANTATRHPTGNGKNGIGVCSNCSRTPNRSGITSRKRAMRSILLEAILRHGSICWIWKRKREVPIRQQAATARRH